jgi:CheY-like chemotaxis protein
MKKILVIDDNAEIRKLIKASLGSKYQFSEADSAADASLRLEKDRPDLILLDIMMPGINGLDWCKLIRRWYQYNDIKIILVSALNQQHEIMEGLQAGADGYITKPFSPSHLLSEIERVLTDTTI